MRHQAAYGRKAGLLEHVGIGVAVFAATAVVVFGIGLWTRYVPGVLFVLSTAILAWHSGFRPALISAVLSAIAIGPLSTALDSSAGLINIQVRIVSIALVSIVVSWLCGNLYRSREQLLLEQ